MRSRTNPTALRIFTVFLLLIGFVVSNISLVVLVPNTAAAVADASAAQAPSPSASVGFNKAVYRKDAVSPTAGGAWTTGDAGKNYRENQWVFYQYQVTGVNAGTMPTFDIAFNHFQTNTQAIFIDAFANFRACLDDTCDDTNASGPMENMLLDGVPYPTTDTTSWKSAVGAISLVNHPYANDVCQVAIDAVNSPSEDHCFHVDGAALSSLVALPATGSHTVTLFYEAHLASSAVWANGLEAALASYDGVGAEAVPAGTIYGNDVYAGWTAAFEGAGAATGSSRHFVLEGPSGELTLPIPAVPAPTGRITVTKVTDPASAPGVAFGFQGSLGAFTLDTDPATTGIADTIAFSELGGGFSFTITEDAPASGWTLTDLVCTKTKETTAITRDVATRSATITLDLDGDDVTCTFTNGTSVAPETHLIVIKQVVNDDGGTATAADFTLTITGVTASGGNSFAGAEAPGVDSALTSVGSYAVSETAGPAGYDVRYSAGCSGTIALGETRTCTVTNDDIAPQLHLRKTVVNDNGGTADATAWTLAASGPTPISGPTPVDSGAAFLAGTYELSESGGPGGYGAGTWSCGSATMPDATHVTVGPGADVTCTITNDDAAAHLIVIKHVVNDRGGGPAYDASDWTLTINGVTAAGGNSFAGAEAPGVDRTLTSVGGYSVTEAGPSGYTADYSADCSGTIALGETKTCTVTNAEAAAGLHLRKIVVNDDGGTATAADWTLTATGPTTISGTSPVDSGEDFVPGTYTLSESGGPEGYAASSWVCDGGAQEGDAVTVDRGDAVTCTITNDDLPAHLVVIKHVVGGPNTADDFTLTIDGVAAVGGNAVTGAEAPGVDVALVTVGSYTVRESAVASYVTSYSADCTGTIALGETKTCTVTNTYRSTPQTGALVVITYHDRNGNGTRDADEPVVSGITFTLTTSGTPLGSLITDVNGRAVRDGLAARTYTLTETLPEGWFSTDPVALPLLPPQKTATVTLGATTTVLFGIRQILIPPTSEGGTILVTKYEDTDRDGRQDDGEHGLSGWSFLVSDAHGAAVAVITTDTTGSASVANLVPGAYTVTEAMQPGWVSTDPGGNAPAKTVTVASGQTAGMLFGNAKIQLPSTSTASDDATLPLLVLAIVAIGLGTVSVRRPSRTA